MGMNAIYRGPQDCPDVIPVFPLSGALLLPRGQMPLNIFEPRYLTMVDDALRMNRLAETGDGRYLITLTGIARFRVEDELATKTPYRLCRVVFEPYAADFQARSGEDEVDRPGVLKALRDFVEANDFKVDWRGIERAPNEALVNALCMMSPFGPREKQALLEAPDLKTRAEALIAITEIELARGADGSATTLQ